ncbi:MAG TPA: NAD(P)/FAD-dependent oxidoreductase [Gammaproteobacteria bacterium]|nr:NAD(P)/FAD-dependent oxidoreductase [Gammaproteobacteria bacterium]
MKIAVIGAGLAGLTTAYRLHNANIDVDIFEAQSRVGGRVYSVQIKNYLGELSTIEWGGQSITDGGDSHYLPDLIQEFSLNTQEKIIKLHALIYFNQRYVDFNQSISETPLTESHIDLIAKQVESIGELIDVLFKNNPCAHQALITRMTAYEGVNAYEQSIYHNLDTFIHAISGGLSKFHDAYTQEKYQILMSGIAGGNQRLPNAIAEKLNEKLHLQKILSKISVSENNVQLLFSDKSIHTYDKVVLAVPISVYKNIDLSESRIPKSILNTIHNIGFGKNYKIAMPFNLRTRNDYRSVMTETTVSFFNLEEKISLMYATKPLENIENLCRITAEGLGLEKQDYSNFVMHDWNTDPFALGSYSGYSIKVSKELDEIIQHKNISYKKLFTPIEDKLFFVGEHTTILDCIGTMEAAVESGERIAKALIIEEKTYGK